MRTENIFELSHVDILSGNPHYYTVGQQGVISITEKPAYGEGDKFFYNIELADGTVLRIFNPDTIRYKKDQS